MIAVVEACGSYGAGVGGSISAKSHRTGVFSHVDPPNLVLRENEPQGKREIERERVTSQKKESTSLKSVSFSDTLC
jgi:hypothetical protein